MLFAICRPAPNAGLGIVAVKATPANDAVVQSDSGEWQLLAEAVIRELACAAP